MVVKVWRPCQSGLKTNTGGKHGGEGLKAFKRGMKAERWRTRFGRTQGGHMADTRRAHSGTHDGHMAGTCLDAGSKADSIEVDTRRTRGAQGLETRPKWTQGGHNKATWRTSSGDAAGAYHGQPFCLRENPTENCLRKNFEEFLKMLQKHNTILNLKKQNLLLNG